MANVLLTTYGTAGDVPPFVQIGRALKGRGHDVTLVTHGYYAGMAEQSRLNFAAFDRAEEFEGYVRDLSLLQSPATVAAFLSRHVLSRTIAEYEILKERCCARDTVLVARSTPGIAARMISEQSRVPLVSVFIAPSQIITTPIIEKLINSFLSADLNRIRTRVGLPPIYNWSAWLKLPERSIALWPEWFATPTPDWPPHLETVGFLLNDAAEAGDVPEEIHRLLDGGEPPVLITGGTGFMSPEFYAVAAEACRQSSAPCSILVTPHEELVPTGMPDKVKWFRYLPFASLMPHMGAVIHHGGAGTCVRALVSAVPQLILPMGHDRPRNATNVQKLGIAETLLPPRWQPQVVAEALRRLITSPIVKKRCRDLADRALESDAECTVCQVVEALVPGGNSTQRPAAARPADSPDISIQAKGQIRDSSPDLIERLSPERRTLLAQRLGRQRRNTLKERGIPWLPRNGESNSFPLSFAQERLWFLDQLEPGNIAYNAAFAYRLTGSLDREALEGCLYEIARRHETLRTTFPVVDGRPVQAIASARPVALPIVDLRRLAEAEREAEIKRLAAKESQRPFDLIRGPLLRATLLRSGDEEHALLLTMHHIVSDGWSTGLFISEVTALYGAFTKREPSPLPELPIQYADYAAWQREWLQGQVLEKQLAYWRQQLAGIPAVLELPADRPRPPIPTFQGASHSFMLSERLTEALKEQSRQEGVTLFMTLLAAFQTLLSRYTGQTDIVVGSPIANRNWREIEELIGCFVNTLVLRTNLSGNPSFRELLGRVRQVALGAYAHQSLPFEKLVEELRPERDMGRTPLFQIMFVFQDMTKETLELPHLTLSPLKVDGETAKFDLTLFLADTRQGLAGELEYSTDLFDAATTARMRWHFHTLLEGVVANPAQRLSDLPFLTDAERYQLLIEWNDTKENYLQDQCVHELLDVQVERTPDAAAIIFEDEHLTYQGLNRRANQLAHYLQALGAEPEVLVGICIEPSLEMIVGLYGILKAGGAYVPLDPTYPRARLEFVLEDTQLSVLLTQSSLSDRLVERRARIIQLDADWDEIARFPMTRLCSAIAENTAYTIYTSGSTGRPKGAQILHRAVVNFLSAMRQRPGLVQQDILVSVTGLSFDIAALELFLPLVVGARTVLVSRAEAADGNRLKERLRVSGATIMQATPATWRLLLEARWQGEQGLRILCGGEVLPRALANKLLEKGERLWNLYGPTETTIWSAAYRVEKKEGLVCIGRPIANTQVYLLDRHLGLAPKGALGELYIGGDGLARGYFKRPDLTADKFIPNLFSQEPGVRLYRTGDLGRYLPDGNIEFLGRMDHQVKVRGYRIELGEIEEVLGRHPKVREAAVAAWDAEHEPGDKQLVAYVKANDGQELTLDEMRHFLQKRLPNYMLPVRLVTLETWPLTPNGKLDRRALPKPKGERPELVKTYVAPRTPEEEILASIWSQVLGIERAGVHDNFFEMGGHSLLAMQVISRVREALQVEIPLRALFEESTIAGLAECIEKERRAEKGLAAPPITSVERGDNLPLSFAQEQLWFLNQLAPDNPFYNIPAAMRLSGRLDVAALKRTLNEIVSRHEALRTTFEAVGGRPVQVVAPALKVELPVVDLADWPDETDRQAQRLIGEEVRRPFNLARGPLLRAILLMLPARRPPANAEYILLFTMHHIVSDGWSMGVLVRETMALYRAFSKGEPSPLPNLPIQYTDYAVWQRNWLCGQILEKQLAYWKNRLAGAPLVLELPTDRPRPPIASFRGASLPFRAPEALNKDLKKLGQQEGCTLFMVLLAAFGVLLYHYTGQEDMVIGSPAANRTRKETEGLIGLFVNSLALRVNVAGNPTFCELLRRVREMMLEAYAHQDLPFGVLVETLQQERDLSRMPLAQVVLALLNAPLEPLELPDLTQSPVEFETGVSKADLEFQLCDSRQGLEGRLYYNTDIFEPATIIHMLEHWGILLQEIATYPEWRLAEISLAKDKNLAAQKVPILQLAEADEFDFSTM